LLAYVLSITNQTRKQASQIWLVSVGSSKVDLLIYICRIEIYQIWIQITILILLSRLLLICQLVYLLLNLICDVLSLALNILVLAVTTGSKPLVSIAACLIIWSLLIYEAVYDT
jgi:hypothetical protein